MKRSCGFTLVELLVVIAIIGILVALLLPAVQAAREAARRTECGNHLKQIGLAMQSHQDIRKRYPMGRTGTNQWAVSWALQLLPYMEEEHLFTSWDRTQRADAPENITTMRTPVPIFYCPSRRDVAADRDFDNNAAAPMVTSAAAAGDYAGNAGDNVTYGGTNSGNPLRQIDRKIAGPVFTRSIVREKMVTDGHSKTLVVGEKHIPPPPGIEVNGSLHHDQGDTAFFAGDNGWSILAGSAGGIAEIGEMTISKFGSAHSSIAQFVYLDGHVKAIDKGIDDATLKFLSAIGDGEVFDSDSI